MDFHPQLDEHFLKDESKAVQTMKFLKDMIELNKSDADRSGFQRAESFTSPANFLAKYASDVPQNGKKPSELPAEALTFFKKEEKKFKRRSYGDQTWENIKAKRINPFNFEKPTFMRLLDTSAKEYEQVVKERHEHARIFRNLGNASYKHGKFESAVDNYTKAIEYVQDSHVLYNNRALAYISTKQYRLSIHDCDHVLMELDKENLRSWMYRALAFKRLGDEKNFEDSVQQAFKFHSHQRWYIEKFLQNMQFV